MDGRYLRFRPRLHPPITSGVQEKIVGSLLLVPPAISFTEPPTCPTRTRGRHRRHPSIVSGTWKAPRAPARCGESPTSRRTRSGFSRVQLIRMNAERWPTTSSIAGTGCRKGSRPHRSQAPRGERTFGTWPRACTVGSHHPWSETIAPGPISHRRSSSRLPTWRAYIALWGSARPFWWQHRCRSPPSITASSTHLASSLLGWG